MVLQCLDVWNSVMVVRCFCWGTFTEQPPPENNGCFLTDSQHNPTQQACPAYFCAPGSQCPSPPECKTSTGQFCQAPPPDNNNTQSNGCFLTDSQHNPTQQTCPMYFCDPSAQSCPPKPECKTTDGQFCQAPLPNNGGTSGGTSDGGTPKPNEGPQIPQEVSAVCGQELTAIKNIIESQQPVQESMFFCEQSVTVNMQPAPRSMKCCHETFSCEEDFANEACRTFNAQEIVDHIPNLVTTNSGSDDDETDDNDSDTTTQNGSGAPVDGSSDDNDNSDDNTSTTNTDNNDAGTTSSDDSNTNETVSAPVSSNGQSANSDSAATETTSTPTPAASGDSGSSSKSSGCRSTTASDMVWFWASMALYAWTRHGHKRKHVYIK